MAHLLHYHLGNYEQLEPSKMVLWYMVLSIIQTTASIPILNATSAFDCG